MPPARRQNIDQRTPNANRVYNIRGRKTEEQRKQRFEELFLISLILDTIRSQCKITLALASSGIAATLLEGGHTDHSVHNLPLNLRTIDEPTFNITKRLAMASKL